MARLASQQVGGYYPTPPHLIPAIAALIDAQPARQPIAQAWGGPRYGKVALLDPCAGTGTALLDLARAWFGPNLRSQAPEILGYACELEAERAAALARTWEDLSGYQRGQVLQGDAFRATWSLQTDWETKQGISLLFLNPPYDLDPRYGRLEQAFLARFTPTLIPGQGILLFVVPAAALAASADTLATEYDSLACYRFPPPDAGFKQVLLLARRAAHPVPFGAANSPLAQQVRAWAADPGHIPEIPLAGPVAPQLPLVANPQAGFGRWEITPLDLTTLQAAVRPWQQVTTSGQTLPLSAVGVDGTLDDLVTRPRPVASPLRLGYVALALAERVFNGHPLGPDVPAPERPPILLKAVFNREFVTTEERTNAKGRVTTVIQIQQPRLEVTALDLVTLQYHTLVPGSTPSGADTLAAMTVADLILHYGQALRAALAIQCPTLHDPQRADHQIPLPATARPLFAAQAQAVMTAIKLLFRRHAVALMGQIGVGKSATALGIAAALQADRWPTTVAGVARTPFATFPIGSRPAPRPVRRVLVMCPPHLLQTWSEEVAAALPGATIHILNTVREADAFARLTPTAGIVPGAGLAVAILSRETAKLSYAVRAGIAAQRPCCPRCGAPVLESPERVVKGRLRCTHTRWVPLNEPARLAQTLAHLLCTTYPDEARVESLIQAPILQQLMRRARITSQAAGADGTATQTAAWQQRALPAGIPLQDTPAGAGLRAWAAHLLAQIQQDHPDTESLRLGMHVLMRWSLAVEHPERDALIGSLSTALFTASLRDPEPYGWGQPIRDRVQDLLLTMTPHSPAQTAHVDHLATQLPRRTPIYRAWSGGHPDDAWTALRRKIALLSGPPSAGAAHVGGGPGTETNLWRWHQVTITAEGRLAWEGKAVGDPAHALAALADLTALGRFHHTIACGEPLWAPAVRPLGRPAGGPAAESHGPQPRRVDLARYITRKYPRFCDLLLIDEAHEMRNGESAQSRAAGRLMERGWATVLLTGTLSGGYARDLFPPLRALSGAVRAEFEYAGQADWVRRYGYLKRLITAADGDADVGDLLYGTMSDRVESTALRIRQLDEAPGVLPSALFRYVLPMAVLLDHAALQQQLPPTYEDRCPILADPNEPQDTLLLQRYTTLLEHTLAAIKRDRFDPARSGMLWGALADLPTYLDRATADTGNTTAADGTRVFAVRYPAAAGGELVVQVPCFPETTLLPKERWLIEVTLQELTRGRGVLIYISNTGRESNLMGRLQRLLQEALGEPVAVLESDRVPTKTRQSWIEREVRARGRRVLLVNPVAVQTGLNSLVGTFATCIFYQNPAYQAIVYRQALGRVNRLGQTDIVHCLLPYYDQTAQAQALQLLLWKIAMSLQADGLDWRAALQAIGAEDSPLPGLETVAIGEALYRLLAGEIQLPPAR